jgi:hypothetical protein
MIIVRSQACVSESHNFPYPTMSDLTVHTPCFRSSMARLQITSRISTMVYPLYSSSFPVYTSRLLRASVL